MSAEDAVIQFNDGQMEHPNIKTSISSQNFSEKLRSEISELFDDSNLEIVSESEFDEEDQHAHMLKEVHAQELT